MFIPLERIEGVWKIRNLIDLREDRVKLLPHAGRLIEILLGQKTVDRLFNRRRFGQPGGARERLDFPDHGRVRNLQSHGFDIMFISRRSIYIGPAVPENARKPSAGDRDLCAVNPPKAAAFTPLAGRIFPVAGAADQRAAEEDALKACDADPARKAAPCFLCAAGDQVVLPRRLKAPLTPAPVR